MVSAATPGEVAPPLSDPAGHGTTQAGAYTNDTLMRLVAGSQSGAACAAAVPMPAPAGPDAARTVVAFGPAAPPPPPAPPPPAGAPGAPPAPPPDPADPADPADGDDDDCTPSGAVALGA